MSSAPLSGWLAATVEQRRQLYRVTKRIVDAGFLTWRDIYSEALDRPRGFGVGYEDNFRAGRISRKNASRIVRYVVERLTRPDGPIPMEFAPELLDANLVGDWSQLVASAPREGLAVIVERDDRFRSETTLYSEEMKSISLQAPHSGRVLGLYGREGGLWSALPLSFSPGRYPEGRPVYVGISDVFDHENKTTWFVDHERGLRRLGPVTLVVIHVTDNAPDYTSNWKGLAPVSQVQLDRLAIHLKLTQPEFLVWRIDLDIIRKPKPDDPTS